MPTITIRDLDEALKRRLRLRAAARGRSMEEEARQILRAALSEAIRPAGDLAQRIRRRVATLGDVQLPIPPREPIPESQLGVFAAGSKLPTKRGTRGMKRSRKA